MDIYHPTVVRHDDVPLQHPFECPPNDPGLIRPQWPKNPRYVPPLHTPKELCDRFDNL